jgi:polar amino acid transport system permease protein
MFYLFSFFWPRSWSRELVSILSVALCLIALVLFLLMVSSLLSFVPEPIASNADAFAQGTKETILLTLIAGFAGLCLGIVSALGKTSHFFLFRWISSIYIWILRGTPLLVQVLFVYFALPMIFPQLQMSDFSSACIALAFNVSAYNAEAVRAGLQAVPIGQVDAARSLGLSATQTFFSVHLPQALKVSTPPLVNNFVTLLKNSSLAYTIGVAELTNIGNRVQSATFEPTPVLITTALIYLVLTTVVTSVADAVEKFYDVEGRL